MREGIKTCSLNKDTEGMMTNTLKAEYAKMREHKPFMLYGSDAQCSLDAAKTVLAFRELERQGKVRLRAIPEDENYFDVYGKPDSKAEYDQIVDSLERIGCFCVVSERFDGCPVCGRGEWELCDSIGMCVCENPLSPYENGYVIDLMNAAIKAVEA